MWVFLMLAADVKMCDTGNKSLSLMPPLWSCDCGIWVLFLNSLSTNLVVFIDISINGIIFIITS